MTAVHIPDIEQETSPVRIGERERYLIIGIAAEELSGAIDFGCFATYVRSQFIRRALPPPFPIHLVNSVLNPMATDPFAFGIQNAYSEIIVPVCLQIIILRRTHAYICRERRIGISCRHDAFIPSRFSHTCNQSRFQQPRSIHCIGNGHGQSSLALGIKHCGKPVFFIIAEIG